jgi:serine/threonine protein phosphatase PrpC
MQDELNIRVDYNFKKNNYADKPYEDFLKFDEQKKIFIVCDGVTRDRINGIYPNPSPASEVAKLFAEECFNEIVIRLENTKVDVQELLDKSFKISNRKILEFNKNFDTFRPGAVALALIIKNNTISFCYIGDCIGIFYHKDIVSRFTESQTKLIHLNKAQFTTQQIRQEICNNFSHPYGFGVLDGNPNAELFIKSASFILKPQSTIVLSTDGIEHLIKIKGEKFIEQMSSKKIIDEAEKLEANHKIRSDDKTVIKIMAN